MSGPPQAASTIRWQFPGHPRIGLMLGFVAFFLLPEVAHAVAA